MISVSFLEGGSKGAIEPACRTLRSPAGCPQSPAPGSVLDRLGSVVHSELAGGTPAICLRGGVSDPPGDLGEMPAGPGACRPLGT